MPKKTFTKVFFIILIFQNLLVQAMNGQNPYPPLVFNISSATGDTGDRVCIDITVDNFTNVESFQLNISYNSTLIVPVCPPDLSGSALAPKISGNFFNCNNKENGYISIVWFDDPTTIPDGSNLFTICFDIIGNPGNVSPVFFNGFITDIEICQATTGTNTVCTETIQVNAGTVTIVHNGLIAFYSKCDEDGVTFATPANLTFYATGGTPPYSYSVNGGLYTGAGLSDAQRVRIDPIPQGVYNIVFTDATGATYTLGPITILDQIPITFDNPIVTNPTCFDRNNGRIRINNIDGGISPYTFTWSNFTSGVTSDNINLTNLTIGEYSVTITDRNGCSLERTFNLSVDTLKLTVQITPASCPEVANGRVRLLPVGGTPNALGQYSYSINNGSPFNFLPGFTLNNRAAGPLNIRVFDALLCNAIFEPIVIPYERTLVMQTTEVKDVTCFGEANGEATFVVNPPNNYNFIFQGNTYAQPGNTFTIPPVGPGNYTIEARDIDGCRVNGSFSINEPARLTVTPSVVQPNCSPTGSISLSVSGGTTPYNYVWSHTGTNASSMTNLAGGMYRVTVTDGKGCRDSLSFTLTQGGTLNIAPRVVNPILCHNQNQGTVTVDINSSNGPFNIRWTNEQGQQIAITQSINFLPPGKYYVSVEDAVGCANRDSVVLNNAPAININFVPTQPTCFGLTNGSVGANVNGGTGMLRYEWRREGNNAVLGTQSVLAPVGAGNYILRVTDANNCQKDSTFTLNQPAKVAISPPEVMGTSCHNEASGRAFMPDLYPDYLWSSGVTAFFTGSLPPGRQWVIRIEGNCVSDTLFFDVPNAPKIIVDLTNTETRPVTCAGGNDGYILIRAMGGSGGGYNYVWKSLNDLTGSEINNLTAGTYVVEITDSRNCLVRDSIVITEPSPLELFLNTLQTVELSCKNQTEGQIAVSVNGGNPGQRTFIWDNGITANGPVASNLSAGNYCVTVTDAKGCQDTFCYRLNAPPPLIGRVRTPQEPRCFGGTTCIGIESVTGGTGNRYTFQINQGPRHPIDSCITVFAGPYLINIIDSAGCNIDTMITIGQPLPVAVDLGEDIEIQLGTTSSVINASIFAPAGVDSIFWSPVADLNCLTQDCQVIEVSPPFTTTYTIQVVDMNGCTGRDDIEVRVKDTRNVYFANVFSPNGDGENDFFQVVIGPGVTEVISFSVYDRWGNRVFLKENYVPDPAGSDGWDGTYKNRALDIGVYVYHARVLFADNRVLDFSGNVTLLDKRRN